LPGRAAPDAGTRKNGGLRKSKYFTMQKTSSIRIYEQRSAYYLIQIQGKRFDQSAEIVWGIKTNV
jgi:hypothetical protein